MNNYHFAPYDLVFNPDNMPCYIIWIHTIGHDEDIGVWNVIEERIEWYQLDKINPIPVSEAPNLFKDCMCFFVGKTVDGEFEELLDEDGNSVEEIRDSCSEMQKDFGDGNFQFAGYEFGLVEMDEKFEMINDDEGWFQIEYVHQIQQLNRSCHAIPSEMELKIAPTANKSLIAQKLIESITVGNN